MLSLALERQTARAPELVALGVELTAPRARAAGTYCARNFVVSEFSPAAQPLETSGFCRSDAVNDPAAAGPSGAQLGPMR